MILIFTNTVIKCLKKDLFWIFRSILIKLLFSLDFNMVTFYFSTIKIFSQLTQSNPILNPCQICSIFQSDTILELTEMKFVNLNGMLTMNILFQVVNKDTAYFGNIKMKKHQLLSKTFKSLSCSIEERKELLDATLLSSIAPILILLPVLWNWSMKMIRIVEMEML